VASVVQIILNVVQALLWLYVVVLWGRIVLDLVQSVVRHWRPRGFLLVVAEIVYTITDPPVRFFRRVLPPLRMGPVALDLSVSIVMLICILGAVIVSAFAIPG